MKLGGNVYNPGWLEHGLCVVFYKPWERKADQILKYPVRNFQNYIVVVVRSDNLASAFPSFVVLGESLNFTASGSHHRIVLMMVFTV
jgi:hypothetical protein